MSQSTSTLVRPRLVWLVLSVALLASTQLQGQTQIQTRPFTVINVVTDYGAKPDDLSDDAGAFRAALKAVIDAPKEGERYAIFIPPGKYHIKSPLIFQASRQLTIIGSGPSNTYLVPMWFGPRDFLLDIKPDTNYGANETCAFHLANFSIEWERDNSNSHTKGIRVAGIHGYSLIDNLRFQNAKTTALELDPNAPRDGNGDPAFYDYVEWFAIRSSSFIGIPGNNPADPLIRSVGTRKSFQIRLHNCLVDGGGRYTGPGNDTRPDRTLVDVEAGEQWVFAHNKFAGVRKAAAIKIGAPEGKSVGMRFIGNTFEGIGVPGSTPDPNNCRIYIRGHSTKVNHPFIAFSSFVEPALRAIVLEDVTGALIMDTLTGPTDILTVGDITKTKRNCLLPFRKSMANSRGMNSWIYPTDKGLAFTNSVSVASNKALDDNGSTNAGSTEPYVAWQLFQDADKDANGNSDYKLDPVIDNTHANARFTLENDALDVAAASVLVARAGGVEAMRLEPKLVRASNVECTQTASIDDLESSVAATRTLEIGHLKLGQSNITNHGGGFALPQKAMEVFDDNGNSLGFILLY